MEQVSDRDGIQREAEQFMHNEERQSRDVRVVRSLI